MAFFGSSDDTKRMAAPRNASANPAEQHNIIGASTVLEGSLESKGNVNIAGTIKGNVTVDGRTMVMPGGIVDGELGSTSAEVAGTGTGRVHISERLTLKSSAIVEGDIRTGSLVVEDGAQFNGTCQMGKAVKAALPSAESKPEKLAA